MHSFPFLHILITKNCSTYTVGVESETDAIGEKTGLGSTSRTRLGTAFGSGTEIVCDDDAVFEYASRAVDLSGARKTHRMILSQ